jgi:predicted small metal-binding protein
MGRGCFYVEELRGPVGWIPVLPSDAMHHCFASLYIKLGEMWCLIKQRRCFYMMSLNCKDIGMDHSFELTGTNEREIMRQFIHYAETELRMPVLTAETIYRMQKAIKK